MRRTSNILLVLAVALMVVFILSANEAYGQGVIPITQEHPSPSATPALINSAPEFRSYPFATCWKTGWGLVRCTL